MDKLPITFEAALSAVERFIAETPGTVVYYRPAIVESGRQLMYLADESLLIVDQPVWAFFVDLDWPALSGHPARLLLVDAFSDQAVVLPDL